MVNHSSSVAPDTECVSQCTSAQFISGAFCASACASSFYQIYSNGSNYCVSDCSQNWGMDIAGSTQMHCVSSCSALTGMPFTGAVGSLQCVSVCPSNTYFQNLTCTNLSSCVVYTIANGSNVCSQSCASGLFVQVKQCVSACSFGMFIEVDGVTCTAQCTSKAF